MRIFCCKNIFPGFLKFFFSVFFLIISSNSFGMNCGIVFDDFISAPKNTKYGAEGNNCNSIIFKNGKIYFIIDGGSDIQRSEIAIDSPYEIGDILYYGFFVDVSKMAGVVFEKDWWIISQFHDQPNYDRGENWATYKKSPPSFAIYVKSDGRSFEFCLNGKSIHKNLCKNINNNYIVSVEFVVKWEKNSNGIIYSRICDDKCELFEVIGENMINDYRHYFKIGQYLGNGPEISGIVEFWDVCVCSFSESSLEIFAKNVMRTKSSPCYSNSQSATVKHRAIALATAPIEW